MSQQCGYKIVVRPLVKNAYEYGFKFIGYFDAHIIPVDVARSKLVDLVVRPESIDELTYETPLLGGIRPHCPMYDGDKMCTGTLNGCLKDGRGGGVTIGTDSGEYDLYLVDYREEGYCVYVKLKANTTIPATNVRYIYAKFAYSSAGLKIDFTRGTAEQIPCPIYKIPYTFRINKPTDTLTIIHCRIP